MTKMNTRVCKVLVAATGSVAALKIPTLIRTLLELPPSGKNCAFEVDLMVTTAAKHFFKIGDLPSRVKMYDDKLSFDLWQKKGDPILHIDLPKLADMLLIAPLDANTMAKIALGLCDNLLTTTIRSWNFEKPLIFCPSMTTSMWVHPITAQHLGTLKRWGCIEIPPVSKTMMCGTTGLGAMADIKTIADTIVTITKKEYA